MKYIQKGAIKEKVTTAYYSRQQSLSASTELTQHRFCKFIYLHYNTATRKIQQKIPCLVAANFYGRFTLADFAIASRCGTYYLKEKRQ